MVTTQELWFSLLATALGSPVLVELIRGLNNWLKGRVSKIAALEAALNEAEAALEQAEVAHSELERRKHALKEEHRARVDELLADIRNLREEIHRLRLALMSFGKNPDEDFH